VGVNAAVKWGFVGLPLVGCSGRATTSARLSHFIATPVTATDVANLNAGRLFYVNIHSQTFPGGEIRGQLTISTVGTEPATWSAVKALFWRSIVELPDAGPELNPGPRRFYPRHPARMANADPNCRLDDGLVILGRLRIRQRSGIALANSEYARPDFPAASVSAASVPRGHLSSWGQRTWCGSRSSPFSAARLPTRSSI
jgi:hypothetical protein